MFSRSGPCARKDCPCSEQAKVHIVWRPLSTRCLREGHNCSLLGPRGRLPLHPADMFERVKLRGITVATSFRPSLADESLLWQPREAFDAGSVLFEEEPAKVLQGPQGRDVLPGFWLKTAMGSIRAAPPFASSYLTHKVVMQSEN